VYQRYIEFNYVGRVLTTRYLRIWHRLARNIRRVSAEDRYRLLLEQMPEAVQRVPLEYLATWLDMRPETLSRMRGRMK
jgi:hypothetical protein